MFQCVSIRCLKKIKMEKIEILAPAGGYDSVVAAVRSGANAVYVGEKSFSARSSAQNFDAEELKNAVAYCHIHGVKLYVTINTIVFDDEFKQLEQAVIDAARADADALIVQNMGVARLVKMLVPNMPLHASTQMSVHTYSGVKALYQMGFKRVVLAREMSSDEILKCAQIPVELEVFVHGALCMCVSGQCYFSAMLGSRSGNRGACAQPCRLPFSVGTQKDGHALSLKDNSLINHIGELEKMGVASAKIEGRMKRPEYVAAVTKACCEQRDLGFLSDKSRDELKSVFSRSGFTDGYYTGNVGASMFGTRRKSDVVSADEKLLADIRQGYKDEIENIEINGKFTAKCGEKPFLEITDGTTLVKCESDIVCEKAVKIPLDSEKCKKQLCKTGGTAYKFKNLEINIDTDISLPLSALNALRRNVLEQLDKSRKIVHGYKINSIKTDKMLQPRRHTYKDVHVCMTDTKMSDEFKKCELVFLPISSDVNTVKSLAAKGFNIGIEIPRGMFGRESQIVSRLEKFKTAGIKDVLCNNIGALYIAKQLGLVLHGGFGLNLVNTFDLLWAQDYGIADVELSFELTYERINALGGEIKRGIISYGYLPLMLCRNCPNKSADINCKTCKNQSKMTDRKGEKFLLKCDGNCTEVLNCIPLFISKEEFSNLSADFNILRFTVENYVENVNDINDFNAFSMLKEKFTRGLYRRGVK